MNRLVRDYYLDRVLGFEESNIIDPLVKKMSDTIVIDNRGNSLYLVYADCSYTLGRYMIEDKILVINYSSFWLKYEYYVNDEMRENNIFSLFSDLVGILYKFEINTYVVTF